MLIEGAIRATRASQQLWDANDAEALTSALDRCEGILVELLASVRPDASETAKDVGRIYTYLFGTLAQVRLRRDPSGLGDVLRVLEIDRETWRRVCTRDAEAQIAPNIAASERLSLEA